MDFFKVIRERHSYRGEFLPYALPESDLYEILGAGICAPSGYNTQTTTYLVVRDTKLRSELASIASTPAMKTAPVIIIPLSEHIVTHENLTFEVEDYAASVENIMLAITAKGYAGVWMDGILKLNDNENKVKQLLKIPASKTVRAFIPLGLPKEHWKQREKKSIADRVTFL